MDEARRLIGKEYPSTPSPERHFPDSSCVAIGGGFLVERGVQRTEWAEGVFECSESIVITLERVVPGFREPMRTRIVDSAVLKGARTVQPNQALDTINFVTGEECSLDGTGGTNFYATVRWGKRKKADWRTGVLKAWGFDLRRGKIVPISPKRVTCERYEA